MRRLIVLLAASLLLLASPAAAAVTHVETVSSSSAGAATAFRGFDAPVTALGDFDGDGRPEIVGHNENKVLYVLASDRARVLAEIHPPYPSSTWGARAITGPVVADVDADGRLDIVVVTSAATVCVYGFTGGSSGTSMSFAEKWCRRADRYDGGGASADGTPWVEDVTGDGRAEVFMQTEEKGLFAYRHDGALLWSRGDFGGNAGPTVGDLNGDGRKEAIFFSDGGRVTVVDAQTGAWRWDFSARAFVYPGAFPVSGAVGDLDGDGRKEVVAIARHAAHTDDYRKNHFGLFVLNHDGGLRWWRQPSWGNPMSYTHPVLVDVSGDGRLDIVAQDWNTIGHKPGAWERLGPANVFAYDRAGNLLWRTQVDNGWSNDDVPVADLDGNGALDVVGLGWHGSSDGMWILDARTGAKKFHVAAPGWNTLRAPVLGDLRGDGKLGLALPVIRSGAGAYLLYQTDVACRVAYGGWQVANPCRPVSGEGGEPTPPPPPPPSSGFDAEFQNPRGNNWWVETNVAANAPLAGVDARVNGGSWIVLSSTSWGSWAKSFHVADGSVVEFRARSTSGATDVSDGYRWPDATPVSGGGNDGGDTGDGSFTASFENVRGNSWWVETDVRASKQLAGVDARVNGGGWIALSRTDWGSWAKSFHVPDGATVEFRARSTDGDSVVSQGHRWPPA